ncbi:hypothetical protein CAOG_07851 [Capsaspora owczarzaki ATCC 30864]|uniref:Carbohydrate kinase FGGY N-terminal domain-containing protein n=1 Tax=Capsaspora owczarzaki (strain ATCC 30864) TaxID=595528 RepID=A0A0D2W0K5_CAPO3|nr:hypothetical protein CAOG_07851 [Capsaspora owczarzaki ATCC 30864]KJE97747.1 hypothetical protein CAOG_007851 [Capsaspora owczarzaki ATCC 30864]|eukprot:XP_004342933.2 hypothetical protein CAOG_07851 [Capsaspora owczarzaki ATCC 30864]
MVVVGLDVGTTSIKIVVLDPAQTLYAPVWAAEEQHEAYTIHSSERAEQDPSVLLGVAVNLLRSVPETLAARVDRIALTGQMHGVVLWSQQNANAAANQTPNLKDSSLLPVSPLITWEDGRCSSAFLADLHKQATSQMQLSSGYGVASLAWLAKNNPDILSKATACGTIMDFVACSICEDAQPCMTPTNAASFGAFDAAQSCWQQPYIEEVAGIRFDLLPRIVSSGTRVGRLKSGILQADRTTEVQVLAAEGDHPCSVYAALNIIARPSSSVPAVQPSHSVPQAILNMGTSSQVAIVVPRSGLPADLKLNPSVEIRPYFAPELCMIVLASQTGGNALAALVTAFSRCTTELSDDAGAISSDAAFSKLIEKGCSLVKQTDRPPSISFRPTFYGERADTAMRGQIANIGLDASGELDFSFVGLFVAACRDLMLHLATMLDQLVGDTIAESSPTLLHRLGIQNLIATGRAIQRNPLLQHFASAAFRVPVRVLPLDSRADSALGVALLALPTV